MELSTLYFFLPACFALNVAPGPNNLLSLSNAVRYGFRTAFLAGAGRLTAFVVMIALASAGLAVMLQTSVALFYVVKVIGACYLLYLTVQLWRSRPAKEDPDGTQNEGILSLARNEFFLAAGNPKAILIFTAFLPQFVNPSQAVAPQLALVGGLFLCLEWAAIAAYACMGAHLGRWLAQPRPRQLFNRACAVLLGSAGLGLLLSRRPA